MSTRGRSGCISFIHSPVVYNLYLSLICASIILPFLCRKGLDNLINRNARPEIIARVQKTVNSGDIEIFRVHTYGEQTDISRYKPTLL